MAAAPRCSSSAATRPRARTDRLTPPDITAVAAFGTENGTKGGAVGHLGFTADGRWRYVAGVGKASFNLTWYGGTGDGVPFNLDGAFAVADVRRRLGESEWWAACAMSDRP